MRILLSNDDGIHAAGLVALKEELGEYYGKSELTLIAPDGQRSSSGHTISLDHPLRMHEVADREFSCSGFPADCVLLGLGHVLKDGKPDVIVSGINRGANLAQDLYYSGTMAAAREAAFHHISAVAVSLCCSFSKQEPLYYESAARIVSYLLQHDVAMAIPVLTMININVPNCPWSELQGIKMTELGFRHYSEAIDHRFDSRERDYYWVAGHLQGHENFGGKSDCEAVADNFVSVTPLHIIQDKKADFARVHKIVEEMNEKVF